MKILFHVFGYPVHFFGVMIAIGILAGLSVALMEVKRKKLEAERLTNIVFYSIVSAIVGARLFYIVFYNFTYYLENPIEIFKITEGGLSIHGGLLAAFIFSILYTRKQKLIFFRYADALAPGIILGQGIGRVGCDVFGKVMSTPLPWGIERQGQLVHPTQIYEFILDYIVFVVLWRKRKSVRYDGQLFLWYIILFSINRSIVELFRYNPSIVGWFSISHLLSIAFIIGAVVAMIILKEKIKAIPDKSKDFPKRHKYSWATDLLIMLGLTIISIVIFYGVQS